MSAKRFFLLILVCLVTPAWAGLNIQHWSTPQGVRVYFVENHDLPMLDLSVDFDAGSARDSVDTSGLAGITHHLMNLGAGKLSERDISDRLADLGAVLGGRLDADRAGFILRTLSSEREREQAIDLLAVILAKPTFAADIVLREKARLIASLKEADTKPDVIGGKAFAKAIYGAHPYGLSESGEVASVERLRRDDLVAFHQRHYRASNMAIALMGDISRAQAEAIASRLAADLPAGPAPAPLAAVPSSKGTEQVIDHHATQSHLFLGLPGLKREDPDYFPLYVGNYVLGGGGFDSRLMQSIRQNKGLAYSVYSYFMPMRELGPFMLGLQTRRETTREAVDTARAELARYLAEGPSEAEIKQARDNLVGGFPLRLDSNKKILEYLAVIGFYHLPLDWLDTYTAKVAAVTREEVVRAFRARLRPEAMSTVIVGGQTETGKTEAGNKLGAEKK